MTDYLREIGATVLTYEHGTAYADAYIANLPNATGIFRQAGQRFVDSLNAGRPNTSVPINDVLAYDLSQVGVHGFSPATTGAGYVAATGIQAAARALGVTVAEVQASGLNVQDAVVSAATQSATLKTVATAGAVALGLYFAGRL